MMLSKGKISVFYDVVCPIVSKIGKFINNLQVRQKIKFVGNTLEENW